MQSERRWSADHLFFLEFIKFNNMSKPIIVIPGNNEELNDNLRERLLSLNLLSDFEILTLEQLKTRFKLEEDKLNSFLETFSLLGQQTFMVVKDPNVFEKTPRK